MRVVATLRHDRFGPDAIDPHPDEIVLSAEVVPTEAGWDLANIRVEDMPSRWSYAQALCDWDAVIDAFVPVAS